MLARRILACACALALAVPAAASAVPAHDPPAASLFTGAAHYMGYVRHDKPVPGIAYYSGPTRATPSPVAHTAPTPAAQPADDGTNGWLIAALTVAGVLAGLMLAAGVAISRRRPSGLRV